MSRRAEFDDAHAKARNHIEGSLLQSEPIPNAAHDKGGPKHGTYRMVMGAVLRDSSKKGGYQVYKGAMPDLTISWDEAEKRRKQRELEENG